MHWYAGVSPAAAASETPRVPIVGCQIIGYHMLMAYLGSAVLPTPDHQQVEWGVAAIILLTM